MTTTTDCPGVKFETRIDPWRPGNVSLYRCTTCHRVFRTSRAHHAPGPTTRSHDATMGHVWAYAKEPADVVLTWDVVFDNDGNPHTMCPHCLTEDTINEADSAIRWNRLNLAEDGKSAEASTGDYDFEGDGWICSNCLTRNLDAPEGFEITNWS